MRKLAPLFVMLFVGLLLVSFANAAFVECYANKGASCENEAVVDSIKDWRNREAILDYYIQTKSCNGGCSNTDSGETTVTVTTSPQTIVTLNDPQGNPHNIDVWVDPTTYDLKTSLTSSCTNDGCGGSAFVRWGALIQDCYADVEWTTWYHDKDTHDATITSQNEDPDTGGKGSVDCTNAPIEQLPTSDQFVEYYLEVYSGSGGFDSSGILSLTKENGYSGTLSYSSGGNSLKVTLTATSDEKLSRIDYDVRDWTDKRGTISWRLYGVKGNPDSDCHLCVVSGYNFDSTGGTCDGSVDFEWISGIPYCCGDDINEYYDDLSKRCVGSTDADERGDVCTDPEVGGIWDSSADKSLDIPYTETSTGGTCCGDDTADDPDWSSTTCETCKVGYFSNDLSRRKWSSYVTVGGGCCGDDQENDCGYADGGYLCYLDSPENYDFGDYNNPAWYRASTSIGNVRYVDCNDREYLASQSADGEYLWQKCDNSFWKTEIQGHDYICNGAGMGSIVECCGGSSCFSGSDGATKSTGGSINSIETTSQRYYCAENADWITDLDAIYTDPIKDADGTTCSSAKNPDGTEAGFNTTKTKCCGDDAGETYSDPYTSGKACSQGGVVNHCSQIVNNYKTIAENGTLYGCNANELTTKPSCSLMCLGGFYCSSENKWKDAQGKIMNWSSTWPGTLPTNALAAILQTECCERTKCWDGTTCADNQAGSPAGSSHSGYWCINGEWKALLQKLTPSGQTGYCPENSQCLYNTNGNYADNNNPDGNPQCIDNGQYIKDFYCENGAWTSRTKYTALQLLSIPTTTEYTLFCDSYQNALNYVGYTVSTDIAENYLANDKVNEFCVLSYGGNVYFGVALNQDINSNTYPFLETLGKPRTYCDDKLDNLDNYDMCSGDNKVWYNDARKIIVYSNNQVTFQAIDAAKISAPAESLISYIRTNVDNKPTSSYDYTNDNNVANGVDIDNTRWYDHLFIGKKGSYSVFGLLEASNQGSKYMAIDYQGLGTGLCSYVDGYDTDEGTIDHIYCASDRYVVSRDFVNVNAVGENFNTQNIWLDLTSKLRLQ